MPAPTTLNGYPVIQAKEHGNGYVTVMVEKPDEFIVATWWPELKTTWSWGHYTPHHFHESPDDARDVANELFEAAAMRNAKR